MGILLAVNCTLPDKYKPDDTVVPDTIRVEVPFEPETWDTVFVVEPSPQLSLTAYEIARLSIGIPPKDSINKWLAFVGLPPDNPFCSATSCWWNELAGLWHPKSGLARHFKTKAPPGMWVSASDVLRGVVTIPAGSMAIYERTGTVNGHVGHVTEDFTGAKGMYISANTSPPSGGSEFAGGGVYEKTFSIIPGAAFRITGFIVY